MNGRALSILLVLLLGVSLCAHALTGSGDSVPGPLETVPPTVLSAMAATSASITVTFSEPMLAAGAANPANYTLSGLGMGTLSAHPDAVTGTGPYTLAWSAGEMRDAAQFTVTVAGVQDAVGNPVNPAGNNAGGPGMGAGPVFASLAADPAQAAEGDAVTLTFSATEALDGNPELMVNGHAASFMSGVGNDYTFTYTVQASDPLGVATVDVSGFDLAGNAGALNDHSALEITPKEVGLPVHTWPAALLLLAMGTLVLRRLFKSPLEGGGPKGRGVYGLALLITLGALICSSAFAASPAVTNVTFTQSSNGTTATQADIHYDLDAPNGPCAITVLLSKDGGADGFVFPVTTVTGDIAGVTTGTGKHIVWDIAADYPNETIANAALRVLADDGLVQHTLTYTASANGSITGTSPQTVNHGASGTLVTAAADLGYHFVSWSDGLLTASRTDANVNADISVTATFAINTYTLTYTAGANGSITGTSPQTVNHGGNSTLVTAVPDPGYHFVQWSDGYTGDARVESFVIADLSVTATFAINTYALTYTAGVNGSITGTSPQTVNHGASGTLVTAVANSGYMFSQWSDGVLTAARTDTNVTANITVTASFIVQPPPVVTSFAINSGAATTMPLAVTLDNTTTNVPTDYMASESATFTGASWQAYGTAPAFTLSFGVGTRTVYFKARNGVGESGVVSDTIFLVPQTVPVAATANFPMGRLAGGTNDDRTHGSILEDPVHNVTLAAYSLGKYEVTNKEYCDVLNWAKAQGYLFTSTGTSWAGTGDIYAGGVGFRFLSVVFSSADCNIQYTGGVFTSKTRAGLPGTTNYSMDAHPMVMVSWYGSVAFCNWLSQMQGLTPCYNMAATDWPLAVAPPTAGGYRLPTEAEWERAAAWDGTKHWIYGFMSDTNAAGTRNRCNDGNNGGGGDNPLGLTLRPYTSPVGWFNGTNVSPNGNVTTVNSPSPVGAYDMSGNVYEWCNDYFAGYSGAAQTNPTGPVVVGGNRILRGGSYFDPFLYSRSAFRLSFHPLNAVIFDTGFRVSRTP